MLTTQACSLSAHACSFFVLRPNYSDIGSADLYLVVLCPVLSHCQLCEMHLALSVNGFLFYPDRSFLPRRHALSPRILALSSYYVRIVFGHRLRRPLPRCLVSSSFTLSILRDFHIVNYARCHLALSVNNSCFVPPTLPPLSVNRICPNCHTTTHHVLCSLD